MWPELFGAGSGLGLLVAMSMLAGFGAIIGFAIRGARPLGPDPVSELWTRYEQGDLTSWEAARLFRILAGQQAAAAEADRRVSRAWRAEAEGTGWGLASSWTAEPAEAGAAAYRARVR